MIKTYGFSTLLQIKLQEQHKQNKQQNYYTQ